MVIDIKMCRFENVPWGFRLVGGSDFEYPLTVVKVTEDSIAEEAGLKVGDIIVRINDIAATPLVHDEANKIIKHCGNVFYFGVYRDEPEPESVVKQFPIIGIERPSTPDSFLDASSSCKSPVSMTNYDDLGNDDYLPDMPDRPCSALSEGTEIKLVEEEIAAVLSGESEVLKDHNTIGVNFYRIFPKPGVCMSSDVLRTLNEEAIKTKAEKDKENKKFTTFLQKPNRPIPKSKEQIEAERRAANAYKVKIVKSAPRQPSPAVEIAEPIPQPEPVKEPTPPTPEVEEPPPADSEVPNLEEAPPKEATSAEDENSREEEEEEKSDKEKEASGDNTETEGDSTPSEEALTEVEVVDEEPKPQPRPQKTEEELALERQLADVQRQLAALSSLPSTIQSTLDAVTKQLAELLPTFKLQQAVQQTAQETQPKQEAEAREISLEKIDEHDLEEEGKKEEVDQEEKHEEDESKDLHDGNNEEYRDIYGMEEVSTDPVMQHEAIQSKEDTRQMEDEQNLKKQKKYDVIDELEEHLERKNNPKRSKRAFGPLTPSSERPLVLPGGRRWYRPKDAYNDEFIAETLSAQAELITGTTLGVNFMKYQKPERKIDLDRSEVYKVIHHLDRQPVRGIEIRPSVVPAEVDIRNAASS